MERLFIRCCDGGGEIAEMEAIKWKSPKRVVKDFLIKFTKKSQMSVSFLPGRVYFPRRMGYNINRDKENLSSKE